jgi:hypothetical protein
VPVHLRMRACVHAGVHAWGVDVSGPAMPMPATFWFPVYSTSFPWCVGRPTAGLVSSSVLARGVCYTNRFLSETFPTCWAVSIPACFGFP